MINLRYLDDSGLSKVDLANWNKDFGEHLLTLHSSKAHIDSSTTFQDRFDAINMIEAKLNNKTWTNSQYQSALLDFELVTAVDAQRLGVLAVKWNHDGEPCTE